MVDRSVSSSLDLAGWKLVSQERRSHAFALPYFSMQIRRCQEHLSLSLFPFFRLIGYEPARMPNDTCIICLHGKEKREGRKKEEKRGRNGDRPM